MKVSNRSIVGSYLADQVAVLQHVGEAIERHARDADMLEYPEASTLINEVAALLHTHYQTLRTHLEQQYEADLADTLKRAATTISGKLAGLYGKVRSEEVSRMLRDDTAALHFTCVCYSMLHATAVALEDQRTASLVDTLLHELTPFVVRCSRVVPNIVVLELEQNGYTVDHAAFGRSQLTVSDAWSGENTRP